MKELKPECLEKGKNIYKLIPQIQYAIGALEDASKAAGRRQEEKVENFVARALLEINYIDELLPTEDLFGLTKTHLHVSKSRTTEGRFAEAQSLLQDAEDEMVKALINTVVACECGQPATGPFPEREQALVRLMDRITWTNYEIVQRHDDGDLTVSSGGKLYVVTTDGKIFEQR